MMSFTPKKNQSYHSCSIKCRDKAPDSDKPEITLPHKSFYFIRHGKTDWNRQGLLQGSTDIPLNDEGIQQAHDAAQLLKVFNIAIETIISSPLQRALKTAEIISTYLGKPIIIIDEVKEACGGVLEGNPGSGGTVFPRLQRGEFFENAECYPCLIKRVLSGIHQALQHLGPVLIVAHGGVYRVLQEIFGIENTSIPNATPIELVPPTQPDMPWSIKVFEDPT